MSESSHDALATEQAMRAAEDAALAADQAPAPATPPAPRWTIRQRISAAIAALREPVNAEMRHAREVGEILDVLGVPRERYAETFDLPRRVGIFVDRLSERLHTQVENNMIYYNLCREVVVLLEGSPNSANFRTKAAIQKLKAATLPPSVGRGERRESSLILPA